jgi:Protein of unknown function (DUF2786)
MAEQKVMSRVMKLLELANDPNTSEHERQLAAEHAERLMAQHMIDRMDLKPEAKSKVVQDTWDLIVGDVDGEFRYHLKALMEMVLKHNGIRVHPKSSYAKNEDGTTNYKVQQYTIVGFPEDVAYAEAVWFRIFKEFVMNISPQWDASKPLSENVYAFIKAGYSWIDTYRIGRRIQFTEWPAQMPNGGPRLRRAYKEALDARGESFQKTRTRDAYRATFVQSYGSTIGQRLRDMRDKAKETVSDGDKFALAIRTTKERVDEEFYRLWPEYDPEVLRRMREAEAREAAEAYERLSPEEKKLMAEEHEAATKAQVEADRKWEARMNRASARRRNYGTVREKASFDHAAWERGHSVASKVNLNVDAEVKNRKKGELGG